MGYKAVWVCICTLDLQVTFQSETRVYRKSFDKHKNQWQTTWNFNYSNNEFLMNQQYSEKEKWSKKKRGAIPINFITSESTTYGSHILPLRVCIVVTYLSSLFYKVLYVRWPKKGREVCNLLSWEIWFL